MSSPDRLAGVFFEHGRRNTVLAWMFTAVLGLDFVGAVVTGRYEAVLFGVVALVIVLLPTVTFWRPDVTPPWYFVALITLPITWESFVPFTLGTPIVPGLAVATLGLLLAVELHTFTSLRLVPWFLVVLTVLFTLAVAGALAMTRWSADIVLGTSFIRDGRTQAVLNEAMMTELFFATLSGIAAGAIFYAYFRHGPPPQEHHPPDAQPIIDVETEGIEPRVLSDRIGISDARQGQLAIAMQTILVGMVVWGGYQQDIGVVLNASMALAITFIPAILERDYQITIEPGLVLWITSAVFLHTLGSWGLYGLIPPWDHLTHTLSATVIAAAGYAAIRAIDIHSDEIYLPPWAMFSLTLVFVIALGVLWELLEFALDEATLLFGMDPVLAQYGIDDTVVDMLFNTAGGLIVATWGTVYLTEVAESLAAVLERRLEAM